MFFCSLSGCATTPNLPKRWCDWTALAGWSSFASTRGLECRATASWWPAWQPFARSPRPSDTLTLSSWTRRSWWSPDSSTPFSSSRPETKVSSRLHKHHHQSSYISNRDDYNCMKTLQKMCIIGWLFDFISWSKMPESLAKNICAMLKLNKIILRRLFL